MTLMPFTEEHVTDRYIGWLNSPEVNRFLAVRNVQQTRETALEYVRAFYGDTEKYIWGMAPPGSGEFVGTATLHQIDRYHGFAATGLMIGEKQFWGKGIAEGALQLIGDLTFGSMGLRRLFSGSHVKNHGINFTLKKLGFVCEGRLRQVYKVGPEAYTDTYCWGILAEEWRARPGGPGRSE